MLTGHCNCGDVSFTLSVTPEKVYVCHCSICSRFTGGDGIPVVIVPNADFQWVSGEACRRVWRKPNADWESNFCATCGSAIPGRNDDNQMFVPAGLLPRDITLTVAQHVFVGSKADWVAISDDAPQAD